MRKIRIYIKNLAYRCGRFLLAWGTLKHHSIYGGIKQEMRATTFVKAVDNEWRLSFILTKLDCKNDSAITLEKLRE